MRRLLPLSLVCFVASLIVISAGLAAPRHDAMQEPTWPLREGQEAPDFALPRVAGETNWKLSDHRGKIVMIDFWATWCGPCIHTMPEVDALHKKFKDGKVEIVSISIDPFTGSSVDQIHRFLADKHFSMPILIGNLKKIGPYVLADSAGRKVVVIPNTYIIDAQGIIRFHMTGGGEGVGQVFEEQVEKLMGKKED